MGADLAVIEDAGEEKFLEDELRKIHGEIYFFLFLHLYISAYIIIRCDFIYIVDIPSYQSQDHIKTWLEIQKVVLKHCYRKHKIYGGKV